MLEDGRIGTIWVTENGEFLKIAKRGTSLNGLLPLREGERNVISMRADDKQKERCKREKCKDARKEECRKKDPCKREKCRDYEEKPKCK